MNEIKLIINNEEQKRIAGSIQDLSRMAKEIPVIDQKTKEVGESTIVAIRNLKKDIEARRVAITGPLNTALKSANDLFRPMSQALTEAEDYLEKSLLSYRKEEEEEARKEAERLQKEVDAQAKKDQEARDEEAERKRDQGLVPDIQAPAPVIKIIPQVPPRTSYTTGGKVTVRKTWTFKVTEPEKVPRNYLEIDSAKITDAIRSGIRDIPGITIYQKESL